MFEGLPDNHDVIQQRPEAWRASAFTIWVPKTGRLSLSSS
jgi:hypothetical protein